MRPGYYAASPFAATYNTKVADHSLDAATCRIKVAACTAKAVGPMRNWPQPANHRVTNHRPTSQAAHPPRLAAPWSGVSGLLSGGPCRAGPAEPDLLRVAKLVWTSSAVGGPSVRLDIVFV